MHANEENLLERKSIRELPDEILLTIFSYLQTHDVKYSIANVCARWSVLAKDKNLWRHLNFKTTKKSTKTFGPASWYSTLRFLETTPELQNVTVSQGHADEELTEILRSLDARCPNLRQIDFDVDFPPVVKLLRGLDRLLGCVESLKVTLTNPQTNVFKTLTKFKKLKKLEFRGANPEPSGFRILLRDCPRLEEVDVEGVDFSKINFTSLWKARDKFTALAMKIDKLDGNCLKLLSAFPRLRTLALSDGNSSPEKLCRVSDLECLARLHLQEAASSPVLTPSALVDFFRGGHFTNLKELKLHKSRLNDEGAAEIRRNCLNLICLEVMTYPRSLSSLTEKALVHFLHCKRLERFEILFDNSEEADWIYRRIRHVHHDCDVDDTCPIALDALLHSWDEIHIPVD